MAVHDNVVYLLFGKENELDDTQGWADFGGGKNKNESVFETAMREGCEELNGFLGLEATIRENYEKDKILSVFHETYTTYIYKVDTTEIYQNIFEETTYFYHRDCLISKGT